MADEVKVTILPPGAAKGASDLRRWARRRLAGQSGLPTHKPKKPRKAKKFRKQEALDQLARRATQAEKVVWESLKPGVDERLTEIEGRLASIEAFLESRYVDREREP